MSNRVNFRFVLLPRLIFLSTMMLLSCAGSKQLLDSSKIRSSTCPDIITVLNPGSLSEGQILADTFLTAKYNYQDLQIANAYGFYEQLRTFERLRTQFREQGSLDSSFTRFSSAYNRINEGTNLALLEVTSVEDLIECTLNNLDRYHDALAEATIISQNRLSNWAVGIGAGTTILTAGVLLSQNEQLIGGTALDWAAVAGGVVAVYLTIKAANLEKKIHYAPDKDFIKAIWTGDNNQGVFPAATWFLLNLDYDTSEQKSSLREMIIDEWVRIEPRLITEEGDEFIAMITQPSGDYNLELIQLRRDMLIGINLGMNQINRALYMLNSKRY